MIREEVGDLVTGKYPVFCHQVNCKGAMRSGIAKQIRSEYPEVYHAYKYLCSNGNASLGEIQPVFTSDERVCINMFAQYSYGRDGQYTNYDAFKKCLENIRKWAQTTSLSKQVGKDFVIAMPKYIGCGLGGGNWNVIMSILEDFSVGFPYDIVLVRKDLSSLI